jgi:hypothetical protein
MRHGRPLAGYEHDKGDLSIPPFTLYMIEEPGLIMTSGTGNEIMGGCLPGIHVYLHIMTEITEGGSFGKFVHARGKN